jgi:hypothetical protein
MRRDAGVSSEVAAVPVDREKAVALARRSVPAPGRVGARQAKGRAEALARTRPAGGGGAIDRGAVWRAVRNCVWRGQRAFASGPVGLRQASVRRVALLVTSRR